MFAYTASVELGNPSADRLAAEVINPNGGDLVALKNFAVIEQMISAEAEAAVNTHVRHAVFRELIALCACCGT